MAWFEYHTLAGPVRGSVAVDHLVGRSLLSLHVGCRGKVCGSVGQRAQDVKLGKK